MFIEDYLIFLVNKKLKTLRKQQKQPLKVAFDIIRMNSFFLN